jgi:DNA transposition AAA+ family ATPase
MGGNMEQVTLRKQKSKRPSRSRQQSSLPQIVTKTKVAEQLTFARKTATTAIVYVLTPYSQDI